MNYYRFICTRLFLVFFCSSLQIYADEIRDDSGQLIRCSNPAKRIISLAPDITETLFAIGAGDRIVGVVSGSDFPAEAKKIPRVGSYSGIDLEIIVTLHPDLIVTWSNTFSRQLRLLKKLGIRIYTTKPHCLEDVARTMKNLGCLTGMEKSAQHVADNYLKELASLYERNHHQSTLRVFYQIGSYSLITINQESWINQAINICGGANVFATTRSIAPAIGLEAVLAADPEVIISDAINQDWKKRWQAWPQLSASKNDMLFAIPPDLIDRAGPRLLEGTKQLCHYLQIARKRK